MTSAVAENNGLGLTLSGADNKKFHVLLAAWAPFHAGAEVAAERLAVGLRDAGHRVTLLVGTDGETRRRVEQAGFDTHHVPLHFTDKRHWWRYHRSQQELRRLMRALRPDILHANDLPTLQMVGQAARKVGIPRICHHRWFFEGQAIDWLNKFGADRHLFVSQALMRDLCRASAGLARSRKTVVYDGLPLPTIPTEADRRSARRALGLPPSTSLVLFAGQIIERKGVEDLLHAWANLTTKQRGAANLILVGDDLEGQGRYRRRMEALAAELQCGAQFVGFQTDVAQWLVAADICVVPSHVEPLGNATLEAMAYARPVVGCDVGGIPEMIVHASTGLLVPPRNPIALSQALNQLLNDPASAAEHGACARRRCEELFSLRSHVNAICEEYRQVLAHRLVGTHV